MIEDPADVVIGEDIVRGWQEIVNLLAAICEIPAALIMRLNEADIEVFVSSESDGNPYRPGNREHLSGSGLYCETVIKSNSKLLVHDALADEQWKNNPDIPLNMISYLGFPILLPNEKPFGTICVLDNKPNSYSVTIEQLMMKFRNMIEFQLEMMYMNQVLGSHNRKLTDYLAEIQALRGIIPICASCKSIRNTEGEWHPIEHYLSRTPELSFSHGICPNCREKLYPGL